jgi:hypothetical protein
VGAVYLVLLVLGATGFFALRGRGRSFPWFAALLGLSLAAAAAMYWGHTRHRLPFDVALAILSGVGVVRLFRRRGAVEDG